VCKRNLSVNSLSIVLHISDPKHLCLATGSMEFNSDLLAGLDRHHEEYSGSPIMHHPVYGPAAFSTPAEPVQVKAIDILDFERPENIDEIFAGLEDIGEVYIFLL
jgi:hypothetical protein